MGTPASFGSAVIRADHDVATELSLSPPKCKILTALAKVGGEAPFSWDDFATKKACAKSLLECQSIDDAKNAIVDLINDGCLREREYMSAANRVVRGTIRLTDKGRNVVAELERFKLVVDPIKALHPDEIAHEIVKSS